MNRLGLGEAPTLEGWSHEAVSEVSPEIRERAAHYGDRLPAMGMWLPDGWLLAAPESYKSPC